MVWVVAAVLVAWIGLREGPAPGQSPANSPEVSQSETPAGGPSWARRHRARVPPDSPFFSRAACDAHLRARPRADRRGPRIASWNVRWFPYGASKRRERGTDVDWLACAIASLDVDVLAVQEFVQDAGGRAALLDLRVRLDALTAGRWRAALDDCAGGRFQHLGFLFDARRVELRAVRALAAVNPGRSACDRGLRPGFAAYARFASGPDLTLITVHLDSGRAPRDHDNRRASLAALAQLVPALAREHRDSDVLLLGDLNDMGCDKRCAPEVPAGDELARLGAELATASLERVPLPAERACTCYHRGRAGTLDHVAASAGMRELPEGARLEVYGPCRDLACAAPHRRKAVQAWRSLSDHCPIVLELAARDID